MQGQLIKKQEADLLELPYVICLGRVKEVLAFYNLKLGMCVDYRPPQE
ncbi:MAG TPA: hypothetical protein VJJ82_00830 [Candidatus Nanoarchaeia archaeon]|nr:hypothetical protein [Candidatus Nanoarchaeia archaeon]